MKKFLSIFLAILMVVTMLPMAAYAATSGSCGDGVYFTIENGTVTITGSGAVMEEASYKCWSKEQRNIKKIVIGNGITLPNSYAFYGHSNLTTVEYGNTVATIGLAAFSSCKNITSFTLREGVGMSDNAFSGARKLTGANVKLVDASGNDKSSFYTVTVESDTAFRNYMTVKGNLAKGYIADIPAQDHTGEEVKPAVEVIWNGQTVSSSNYDVTYSNNIELGTATVTVKGKDANYYTGTLTQTFEIKPHVHDWSNKDGVCASGCGYACPHEWGEGVLTRPIRITTTDWDDGYYTYTCSLCGHYYQETVKRADYSVLDAILEDFIDAMYDTTLLDSIRNELEVIYFDNIKVLYGDYIESEQAEVDALVETMTQKLAEVEAGVADGSALKPDYTEIDEAIAEIEQKLDDENITDEGKAGLEEIKAQLEEMKADVNTSEADLAELEKALENYEAELDKGIEDGTLVEIDINKIADEVNKKWAEKLEAEGLLDEYEDFINNQKATDEALAAEKEINDFIASLEGTVAENAENIAKLNEMLNSFTASFENCLRGTHNFKDYEITSPAKCEVNAKETGTCWFCGETDEREVEGTALEHSFTKYEVTEEAKCGVAGKEVAYCDNGCQTTDERETPALEHIFLDYVSNGDATCTADGTKTAECENGCGTTDTIADEGSMLDHTDEDGDKLCDDCGEEVYDRCDICGGKAHGDDKIKLVFCMIITIIRFVTLILKSIN